MSEKFMLEQLSRETGMEALWHCTFISGEREQCLISQNNRLGKSGSKCMTDKLLSASDPKMV
jgi:hypothetical protein